MSPPKPQFRTRAASAGRVLAGNAELPAEGPDPLAEPPRPISAIIACYDEQDTIEAVLKSPLAQTRPPDAIRVIVNDTDYDTIEIANR